MPELPEVETVRRSLTQTLLQKKIIKIIAPPSKVFRPSFAVLERALIGHRVESIDRVGKLLIFSLDTPDNHVLIHLKMTGQLIYVEGNNRIGGGHSLTQEDMHSLPHRHTRASIYFEGDGVLYFNDMRLFGYLELANSAHVAKTRRKFGPELISAHVDTDALARQLKKRTTSIKAVLLNQQLIAGIGNIYTDEMCFAAGILPDRSASNLTIAEYKKLFAAGKTILELSIAQKGTTFNHFVDGNGTKGNFLSFLKVYGRAGKPCLNCGTILQKKKVAGRGTVFCTQCQK